MSFPTVAQLCRSLPHDLLPVDSSAAPPRTEISAVHVSELLDPTVYLSGGELLLTTGLTLPDNDLGLRRYVGRLHETGVAALGLGLGPHLQSAPPLLERACADIGLPLLVVPPAAAFLTISKEYWAARSRSRQRELTDTITAHGRLAEAMLSPDPMSTTLRALSSTTGAWSCVIGTDAQVSAVYPAGRAHDALDVATRITASPVDSRSVVTLPVGDESVVIIPIAHAERVVGFLAVGAAEPLGATTRRLALTAATLLSTAAVQLYRRDAAQRARGEAVTALLDMGLIEAARRLSAHLGVETPSDTVQILMVHTHERADVVEAVVRACPTALPSPVQGDDDTLLWFVMRSPAPPLRQLVTSMTASDPDACAIVSAPLPLTDVHHMRTGLSMRLRQLSAGEFVEATTQPGSGLNTAWAHGLESVMAYRRADLTTALAAYLRHRGQWDAAARDLGVHRNTLRHRMSRVSELLGADIDDPDVASQIWLHLRSHGRA